MQKLKEWRGSDIVQGFSFINTVGSTCRVRGRCHNIAFVSTCKGTDYETDVLIIANHLNEGKYSVEEEDCREWTPEPYPTDERSQGSNILLLLM